MERFDPSGAVPLAQRSQLDRRLAEVSGLKTGAEFDRWRLAAEVKKQRAPRAWVVGNCERGMSPERKAEFTCLTAVQSLDDYARCRDGREPLEFDPR